jgi:hypothetical protein
VRKPAEGSQAFADAEEYRNANRTANGQPLPYCPQATITTDQYAGPEAVEAWGIRGAMNAGFSVFLFLNELSNGRVDRTPYNQCEKRKP